MQFKEFKIACKNKTKCKGDLLFIHGYCVSHEYFSNMAERLSEHFNIYMIDLPGHGVNNEGYDKKQLKIKFFIQHVIDYVEYAKLNNFILIGHSMGGAIVSGVGATIGDKIKKLVIVSPYGLATRKLISHVGLFKALRVFFPHNWEQKMELADTLYKDYHAHENDETWKRQEQRELNWQLANWDNMKALGRHLQNFFTMYYVQKIQKSINCDTMLLLGKYDKTIDCQMSLKLFNKYFANKKLQTFVFENSGHLCFEEEPNLFEQKVLTFLS
ncbi:MAG: alpha/beta hydrolase [Mycoplasmataceae bacterium]|nr:alpha/beta hydrolase [Mycoplasmataceae bacterium]